MYEGCFFKATNLGLCFNTWKRCCHESTEEKGRTHSGWKFSNEIYEFRKKCVSLHWFKSIHIFLAIACVCISCDLPAACPLVYDQGSESPRSIVSCTKYTGVGASSTSFFVLFWFFSHCFCPSPSPYQHLAGFLFSQVCCFFIQVILKLLQLLLRRKHFARIN